MIMDFVEADNGLYFWDMDAVEPNGRNKPPAKTWVEAGVVYTKTDLECHSII